MTGSSEAIHAIPVIASGAKQSMARHRQIEDGLLRSARNDGAEIVDFQAVD